jgi:hypothetical protein
LFRHFQSTTHATTVKQAKAKKALHVARWMSLACSLIRGCFCSPVAPFWSEWRAVQMSKNVTPQRSERVCPRGRPRGHLVIKYSIIDR